jgi:nucleoside-diphosphate-sugar epimerase
VGRTYRRLYPIIPLRLKKRLHLGEYYTATPGTGPSAMSAGADPRELYLPDESRFGLWTTRATYQIDKARRLLGYQPKYTFDEGFRLTADYLRWADLVPTDT